MSAWLVGASPLVQIYQSLSMAEGEASCAAEWATFVQQNISSPVVANVTAGNDCVRSPISLQVMTACLWLGTFCNHAV